VKPVPLLGAIALAVFLVLRRRKLEPTTLAGGAIAVVVFALYGLGIIHLPNLQETIKSAGERLGSWTYLLVGALAFLETGAGVGLLAPGEFTIILGGFVAGQGKIDVIVLIGIVWACAVAGDLTSFYLGRRLGRAFLVKHGPKVHINEDRLRQVEAFFDRHGGKAILLGRFVGLVRAIAPFLAGSSGLKLRRFVPYDVLGAGLWGTTFVLIGYIFWQSFDRVVKYAEKGALALGTTITVVVLAVWAWRWLRVEENRRQLAEWAERQAWLRPVLRVVTPVVRRLRRPTRFVWNRVTPGELGLELTTLLSIFAVSVFVVVAFLNQLTQVRFTQGDLRAFDMARDLRSDMLDHVAKIVSDLGALPVTGGLVLVTSIFLFARHEALEGAALLSGMVVTYVAVHLLKNYEDRPRPTGSLVDTMGSSFPSGHAAYAMAWVAVAVALGRVLPGLVSRTLLVVIALVLGTAIAASRVYLRAHFLSDVLAGAAVGAASFSLCAMIALIVSFLRHNPPATR
jgi:undecaprenyl-diphosphatase